MQDKNSARFMYEGEDLSSLVLFLVKGGLRKPARDEIAAASAKFITKATSSAGIVVDQALDADASAVLKTLHSRGYAPIADVFSSSQIDGIQEYLADKVVTFEDAAVSHKSRGECLVEAVPENVRLAHYQEADVLRCPFIYDVVHSEKLINLVGSYFQAPPTISTVACWWSFPDKTDPETDQRFHHDRDDFNVTKLFVYLSDVTAVSGPHAYIPQTHNFAVLQDFVARRLSPGADSATFWDWMEKFFKPDSEILQVFGAEQIQIITGPSGTSFIEDTRGLHRAVYPRTGFRLAFEISFTVLPKYNQRHVPVPRNALDFANADGRPVVSPLVQYATRLLYT
jgi:hypothetical protein